MNDAAQYPYADLALSRGLERTEGAANREFVETRARLDRSSGACAIESAGTLAMFDRPHSPLTQTFCLGLFEQATEDTLGVIEHFLESRGARPTHEVSPLAGESIHALLHRRGYEPVELSSVLYRPVAMPPAGSTGAKLQIRIAEHTEAGLWSATAARGWGDPALADFFEDIGTISIATRGTHCFFADAGGVPVATGLLSICEGVALLAGASTVPESRGLGAQSALLDARLRFAAEQGCDLVMMCAAPGSTSQRNAERHGFRVAYTRVKWQRAETTARS